LASKKGLYGVKGPFGHDFIMGGGFFSRWTGGGPNHTLRGGSQIRTLRAGGTNAHLTTRKSKRKSLNLGGTTRGIATRRIGKYVPKNGGFEIVREQTEVGERRATGKRFGDRNSR